MKYILLNIPVLLDMKSGDNSITCLALPNHKGLQGGKGNGPERTLWRHLYFRGRSKISFPENVQKAPYSKFQNKNKNKIKCISKGLALKIQKSELRG